MLSVMDQVSGILENGSLAAKAAVTILPVGIAIMILNTILSFFREPKFPGIPRVSGGLPYVGNALPMVKGSPWDTMTEWAMKYGRTYIFKLFGSDCLCVSDAEVLKVILSTKLSVFKKDLQWTYKPFLCILGNGLVTADGNDWRNQRVLLSSHLRIDILEYIPAMALAAVHRLAKKLDAHKQSGEAINMAEEFRHLTLQVIAEAVLSISAEESDATFAHMYLPIVEEGNLRTWDPTREFLPTPAWFQYQRAIAKLNDYVTGIITKRWALRQQEAEKVRAGSNPASSDSSSSSSSGLQRKEDILDKILGAVSPADWNQDVVSQICGEVKTFILAGHETSASMLTWSLYELSLNPELRQRVIDSANACFGPVRGVPSGVPSGVPGVPSIGNNKLPTVLPDRSVLDQHLQFAESCLREALRKYSNVPSVVRVASEDITIPHPYSSSSTSNNSKTNSELSLLKIPRGTTVMLNLQGVHHDPEYWPEPLKYDPYRFFEKEISNRFTFLAFIEGPRMCLGQYLALLESKIVLSLCCQHYSFECCDVAAAGERHAFMIPVTPKHGHMMRVK